MIDIHGRTVTLRSRLMSHGSAAEPSTTLSLYVDVVCIFFKYDSLGEIIPVQNYRVPCAFKINYGTEPNWNSILKDIRNAYTVARSKCPSEFTPGDLVPRAVLKSGIAKYGYDPVS